MKLFMSNLRLLTFESILFIMAGSDFILNIYLDLSQIFIPPIYICLKLFFVYSAGTENWGM